MKKHFFNILRLFLLIAIGIIIYFVGILLINTVNDYKPEGGVFDVAAFQDYPRITEKDTLSIVTWNIGYAGLGKNADFFYDGGKMSKPTEEEYNGYWKGILQQIQALDSLDFMLLQEVDIASSRSYGNNQHTLIEESLSLYSGLFTKNYDVIYVPMPVFDPMARVESGLSFFTRKRIIESSWRAFDGNRSWPLGLFMPDRCYSESVFKLSDTKLLYIINTHNSAFDDGSLRNRQLEQLYEHMRSAYENGHYVIVGGDWNINPAGYTNGPFMSGDAAFSISGLQGVSGPDPDWLIVFDPDYPSNRDVSALYTPGHTPTTIIDFFVCSPNVHVLGIETLYAGFEHSDHHPVYLRFTPD